MARLPAISTPLRREFGPTLPALLRERFGVAERVTLLSAGAVVVVIAAIALLFGGESRSELRHRGDPAFSVLYTPEFLRPAKPQPGELSRVEGRRGGLRVSHTVSPLAASRMPFGALPLYAEDYIAELRAQHPGMDLIEEGKARIWGQPGYHVEFRAGDVYGNDVLIFPDDIEIAGGVLLRLRHHGNASTPAQRELVDEVRRVQRSFQFGTSRL